MTSYRAELNENKCKGCGTCAEKCPIEAISLIDNKAHDDEDKCIGCGVCVHYCPEEARSIKQTALRKVFIPAPKLANL
jgi:ferredoxin